jgi:hypothetical protein
MTIEEKVKDWAFGQLSKVSEQFNNMSPCPYAKATFVNDKVSFVKTDYKDFLDTVTKETLNFTGEKDVVIVYSEHNPFGLDYLEGSVEAMNFALNHMKKDIWLLGFHHEWTMVFIQKITKLDDASIDLEQKGYYNNYNKDQFDHYVAKRRKLRDRL